MGKISGRIFTAVVLGKCAGLTEYLIFLKTTTFDTPVRRG